MGKKVYSKEQVTKDHKGSGGNRDETDRDRERQNGKQTEKLVVSQALNQLVKGMAQSDNCRLHFWPFGDNMLTQTPTCTYYRSLLRLLWCQYMYRRDSRPMMFNGRH